MQTRNELGMNVSTVKQMLAELKDAGFDNCEIHIEYNGSGDSGDLYPPDLGNDPALKGAIEGLGYAFEYGPSGVWNSQKCEYEYAPFDAKKTLLQIIADLIPGGWEINEGSSGEVVLSVNDQTVTVKHNANVMTTEYSEETY
jgi:hypothetical protein